MRQGPAGFPLTQLLLIAAVHAAAQQISPQLLVEGKDLSPAAARNLEASLEKKPDDIAARLRLIGYYAGRTERMRHILWLVARRPDHELFSWPEMYSSAAGAAPSNPEGFEQWKRAWLDQLSRSGEDGLILFNAACSLGIVSDRAEFEEMTRKGRNPAPRAEEWSKALGEMYATVVVRGTLNPAGAGGELAKQSESILSASDDLPLLRAAAATVQSQATLAGLTRHATILRLQRQITTGIGRNTVVGGVPGGVLGGIISGVPTAAPPPPPPPPKVEEKRVSPPQRIRVGGNVQSAKLKRQPKPVYPPLARQARIQGVVRFSAVIGKDGSVQSLQLVSGHPLLVQSAQDAAKQWLYEPTLLNGEAVEVITQVDVNFTLSQ
jgi:TonB family protein